MRMRTTPILLSSVILGGWLGTAAAQSVAEDAQAHPKPTSESRVEASGNTSPGTVRRPTPEQPGTVFGVSLGELYTDNVHLVGRGQPKQSSWITKVEPFVRSAWSSPRLSGVLDYSLSGYLYTGQENDSQVAQHLNTSATWMVVPQHLFVDGRATYAQAIIDNQAASSTGTYFLSNNLANVGTLSLSPYWRQGLGPVGTLTLRYTQGRVVYNRHGLIGGDQHQLQGRPDVSSNGVRLDVVSPDDEVWGWNLSYNEQHLNPDAGRSVEFAEARLGVSRQLGTHLRIKADGGRENRYLLDGSVKKLDAGFWDAGFEWSNVRNHFELMGGHHFYGRSARFSWTHQAALLRTQLRYEERPTDLNRQFLGQQQLGVGLLPSSGTPGVPSLLERQVYLMKRFTASASYEMPEGRLSLTAYREARDYFLAGSQKEKVADAHLTWRFDLGPSTTLTPELGWQRYRFRDGRVNYSRYVEVGMVHQFNPDNFATLQLHHGTRTAHTVGPGAHGFRVNVVFVQWTHLF